MGSVLVWVNPRRVGYEFDSVKVWVGSTSNGVTVTRFRSGMGSIHFGSGEIRLNIRVNVKSRRIEDELSITFMYLKVKTRRIKIYSN